MPGSRVEGIQGCRSAECREGKIKNAEIIGYRDNGFRSAAGAYTTVRLCGDARGGLRVNGAPATR